MASVRSTCRLTLAILLAVVPPAALADTRIERELPLSPGGRLVVEVPVGAITVTGGAGSGARVVVTSERDLDELMELSFEDDSGGAAIRGRKHKSTKWRKFNGKVRFEIEVPRRCELELDTSGGAITVESIEGQTRLDTSGGAIRVVDLDGDLNADTSGGSITVENVTGDVVADTSGGDIKVTQVEGRVEADTSGGSIRIRQVRGDVSADTSGGSILVTDAGGRVNAVTSGGTIEVAFAPGNARGGSLNTSGGGIDVTLDRSVSLDLDAEASGGSVRSDVPVTVVGKVSKHRMRGTVGGGGETLRIRTSGGSIRIHSL